MTDFKIPFSLIVNYILNFKDYYKSQPQDISRLLFFHVSLKLFYTLVNRTICPEFLHNGDENTDATQCAQMQNTWHSEFIF